MSFSDYYVTRRNRKGNFLNQVDQIINRSPIKQDKCYSVGMVGSIVKPVDSHELISAILEFSHSRSVELDALV